MASLGVGLICLGLYLFTLYGRASADSSTAFQNAEKQIIQPQTELTALREEILDIEDEFYKSIDLLEVSIHSFKETKPQTNSKPKIPTVPFETELRHWRYLGLSEINNSQRAFFQNAKGVVILEKGSISLGEWRLNYLEKTFVTFTYPQGRSLTLKPSRPE